VRPVTVTGEPAAVALNGPQLTRYDVMGEPPLDAGGTKRNVNCPLPGTVALIVGAPGTLAGVTVFEGADARPVPIEFVAITVKVYAVPFVRPVTVMGDAAPLAAMPPGDEVAVYDVIAEPPVDAGGVNVTVACAFPAVAVPIVGGPGTAAGVTLFEGVDGGPVPTALVAVTVKV
jgi:hypothetical protein